MEMIPDKFLVGDSVFIFSENLDEVIEGTIEGFNDSRTRVKILQETPDGLIRHVVSWVYIFKDKNSAESVAEEYRNSLVKNKDIRSGITVHLIQSQEIVKDAEGNPYNYQVIKVYQDKNRASLVNSYGEYVGTFDIGELKYSSSSPLFRSTDYHIGQLVNWIEQDDVYEGVITKLRESTAEVSNIKKLLSLDQKKNLPYYKIQSDDLYNKIILTSIVGDNIDSE